MSQECPFREKLCHFCKKKGHDKDHCKAWKNKKEGKVNEIKDTLVKDKEPKSGEE